MDASIRAELGNILECYDLGAIVEYEQDRRGYVNTSFAIQTEKNGVRKKYFLRRYKSGVSEEEVLFEHNLIQHLSSKGFSLIAKVIENRYGNTYLHIPAEGKDQNGVFYAIFDFLGGEDRYTWVNPVCTPTEIASSAEVLADFHRQARDLVLRGKRVEPKILELLPQIETTVVACLEHKKGSAFCERLSQNSEMILSSIRETIDRLGRQSCSSMIELIIHCDYHPGNLKFDGEEAVGLFDFDWSKVDLRCYDVALALWYFFSCWEPDLDGSLRLEDCELFLASYQDVLMKLPGLEPMTAKELNCLTQMIAAANLYILNWTLRDFLYKEVDEQVYRIFLEHSLNTIRWLDEGSNQEKMKRVWSQIAIS